MQRCIAMLALLVATHGVVNAQNVPRWSWQEPHAKVLPTGDLEWAPKAFEFKVGGSVRYIDFESGNDANDGLSKQTPWKHHPWDPNAGGRAKDCEGLRTYVFKQGVDYRGEMDANESGTQGAPIILTRDPSWGEGPAVICGSEAVAGWKKGADNRLIPEPENVWYVDLDWAPRNVWTVGNDGVVTRIALARTPNWTITDPDDVKSEWWTWKNPDKPFDNYATIKGQRRHLAFDKEHINQSKPQDYYEGAVVWTTKGWVMGSPFPARVLAVDREKGSLTFPGQWGGGPSYKIIRGCRYYLEDKPQYLDGPGEFWFDRKGDGGRLYIRLPGDRNPNEAHVEVAKRIRMIDSRGMSHVRISGLTFRFTNTYWNLTAAPYWVSHESVDVEPGCVRLLGSGTGVRVTHCTFEHVHKGVRLKAAGRRDAIDKVVVDDNVFSDADSGGVELADSSTYGDVAPPMGRLYDVRVRRNKFDHIGIRPDLFGQGGALVVNYAQTAEVAGNIFDRVCAQGIDVHGAKPNLAATDRPFTRILIHHNKVVDSLLNVDDFGGIETWQGGPAYVYDNISGNPGGYRNWDHVLSPDTEDRFGHAYYLDGAFKNYYFNNIAWGKSKGPSGKLANTSAFQEIISYENTFFNNTLFNFVRGSRRQAPQAGRVKFLGNIWQSMGLRVFRDADPARTADAGNEADAGPRRNQFAIETDAYARNVFYDLGESFGVFEPSGRWHSTLQSFQEALESYQPLAASVGVMAEQSPLRDAAAHDFRPSADSAARGLGAKVFVPWSLYETVGEWSFYPIQGDPARIMDEHWCMAPYYTGRDDYYKFPMYPLKGVNVALEDYQNGPLENWTTGALHFNGRDQYAVLTSEDIDRTVSYSVSYDPPQWVTMTFPTAMQPGKSYQVTLALHDVKDGLKLHADLNWSKKNGAFGGGNTWGGPAKDVKGPGPYSFTFQPQEKPDLGSFVLTVYLSTTGDWKDHTLLATEAIPVGDSKGKSRSVTMGGDRINENRTVSGADLTNPQIDTSNFLIEAYFKTAPGQKGATLIQKMDDAGYALRVNEAGGVTLTAQAVDAKASLAGQSAVNDGQWHHVIAESDRKAGTFTIYVDGKQDATGPGLGADASLANDADLYVAGTPQGHNLDGVIEFLRIARGTLADSQTTIEELYAWEFNGPFLDDFTGRERPADGGAAGAIDDVTPGPVRAVPGAADTHPGTEHMPRKTIQPASYRLQTDILTSNSSGTVIDVTDYGAVCDGKTDDTVAIQKAINAAEAAGGGVVDFASGTCLLDSHYPSSHPWFFYNLIIGSNVILRGTTGTKLLQGPGGRHPLPVGAAQVRNTVLAFGSDYTVIRFQNTSYNGGFYGLKATTANDSSVTLFNPSDASHFEVGDYVAIYEITTGDVIPTETSQVTSVNRSTGVLSLTNPLARSFATPSIARVTSLATTNVGVQNIIVQGAEPLAATEIFGFTAQNNQFIIDTSVGGSNVLALNLNTLHGFQFIGNTFTSVGPKYAGLELPQRNSRYGLFDGNTLTASNVGFGEYAAHMTFTNNHFRIHADPSVIAGIAIGGKDVTFRNNDVRGGNITGGSGWGVMLADFVGVSDYAAYVGQIRIDNNTFNCRADGNACLGVFAADTSVTGNTIVATGSALGIHAEGPLLQANRIRGNTLSMGSGDGMLIVTPSTGGGRSVITGNIISGSGAHGIYVNAHGAPNAGGNIISNNTITGFATPISIN